MAAQHTHQPGVAAHKTTQALAAIALRVKADLFSKTWQEWHKSTQSR
jgi:hypothetical protein